MSNSESPSFDLAEARRQAGDDEAILREVLLLFLEDNPKTEANLRQALERRDAESLERAAHTIKGSCAIFGAFPARRAAERLELLGKAGDFKAAPEAMALLLKETGRLAADLRGFLESSPA